MIYEIFARKGRGEALRHIGNLNAPDDELARVYAFSTYDEEKWFDMFVVPRDRFIEVFNRLDAEPAERASAMAEGEAGDRNSGKDAVKA
jgi:1,2-phenylacetyl-CoA epoxidase PaaB subunit